MLDQVFLSPQVKQSVIIGNKHVKYKSPQNISSKLRLKNLKNWPKPKA